MEKPHKYWYDADTGKEHPVPGRGPGPGLREIDPFQANPAHPSHRDQYKSGLYNYDLSAPLELSDEEIDRMEPDDPRLDLAPEDRTPEKIQIKKNRMKQDRRRTMSGFSVIQSNVSSPLMTTWYRANSLGLLGDVPDTVKDPFTGDVLPVNKAGTSKETGRVGAEEDEEEGAKKKSGPPKLGLGNLEGKKTRKGRDVSDFAASKPLTMPLITQTLNYEVEGSNGRRENVSAQYNMPYLLPGRYLGRINLTDDQRKELARRRGKEDTQGLQAVRAGQAGWINDLLRNADILNPEQLAALKSNARDPIHIATALHGRNKDPYSQSRAEGNVTGGYYTIGYSPGKVQRGMTPLDLDDDQLKAALDKYYGFKENEDDISLMRDANDGVNRFFEDQNPAPPPIKGQKRVKLPETRRSRRQDRLKVKRKAAGEQGEEAVEEQTTLFEAKSEKVQEKRLPPSVMQQLHKVQTDMQQVAAAILAYNINNPNMGIRDEELGLLAVPPGVDPDLMTERREQRAYNFAKDLSQAAFGDKLSRRWLEKGGGITAVSTDQATGEGEKKTTVGASMSTQDTGKRAEYHPTRRGALAPFVEPDEEGNYRLARNAWVIPRTLSPDIDKLFKDTTRAVMRLQQVGYNQPAEAEKRLKELAEKVDLENKVMLRLIQQSMDQMRSQNQQVDMQQAKATALEQLPAKLRELFPDLYQQITPEEMQVIKNRNQDVQVGNTEDDPSEAEFNEELDDFFTSLFNGRSRAMPIMQYEDPTGRDKTKFEIGFSPRATSLDEFVRGLRGIAQDAPSFLNFCDSQHWSRTTIAKWAIPLYAKVMGISETEAGQALLRAGAPVNITAIKAPVSGTQASPEAPPTTVKMPQQLTQPAQAASDISGLIRQVVTNPAASEQLVARLNDIKAGDLPAVQNTLQQLQVKERAAAEGRGPALSNNERFAIMRLKLISNRLAGGQRQ